VSIAEKRHAFNGTTFFRHRGPRVSTGRPAAQKLVTCDHKLRGTGRTKPTGPINTSQVWDGTWNRHQESRASPILAMV